MVFSLLSIIFMKPTPPSLSGNSALTHQLHKQLVIRFFWWGIPRFAQNGTDRLMMSWGTNGDASKLSFLGKTYGGFTVS